MTIRLRAAGVRWRAARACAITSFSKGASSAPAGSAPPEAVAEQAMKPGVLWVVEDSYVRPIPVRAGLSDGIVTEVEGPELSVGMDVVTGVDAAARDSAATTNPFAPKLPKPPRGGPPPG